MLSEGMYIADRYEVLGKIGTGGMSDVYKAMDHILGRHVAIKVLKQEFSEDTNFVTKFRTEAQAAAGLEHPNIVNIYDVGSENKMHYIVMECIEGITLKTYIEKKGKLSFKETISIAIQVSNGIRAAHNKQIVHRDIKPQNIIISTEGKVKVTDFGIARAATTNTISSDVMGSVHYTSPEQARNGFVDFKSDIYSLGIVMYEMVTGRVPFSGDSAVAVAIQHLQEDIISPGSYVPDLPVSLEKIILKCTQKSPDRRYSSVDDLIVDLKKALISPNEDFVSILPNISQDKTRVISQEELNKIKNETSSVHYSQEDEVEEDGDNNGILNPKMEKAVTIMGIVAAVIIVAIIVAIIGYTLDWFKFGAGNKDNKKDDPKQEEESGQVEMINITGQDLEEAQAALQELGLGLRVNKTVDSDEYEENQIVLQDIEAGEMVAVHTTINVTLCSGAQTFELTSVIGKTEDEAKKILADLKLHATIDYQYDDKVEAEKIISMSPSEGSLVKEGDAITLIVSRGSEAKKVPTCVGLSENAAKTALSNAGFVAVVKSANSDTVKEGTVISQSIDSGKEAEKGSKVTIVVSLGKQDVLYNLNYQLTIPDGDYSSVTAKVEIYLDESDEKIYSGTITSFPKTIKVGGIKNCSRGVMYITWTYQSTDENGETVTSTETEETTVNFTKAN
ncbi:MAG: Stk1 family PASTA domain-containing Ser/Thr kinase [Lachnospiraceae bacterium]